MTPELSPDSIPSPEETPPERRLEFLLRHLRAGFLLYLVGIITACQFLYFSETYFPLDLSFPLKALILTAFMPGFFVLLGFSLRGTRQAAASQIIFALEQAERPASQSLVQRLDWLIIAGVLFSLWAGGYMLVAQLIEDRRMHQLLLEPDTWFPLAPSWVWIYLGVYPVFLVPLVAPYPKRLAKMVMLSYITLLLLCYLVFLIVPVAYPRPALEVEGFSSWALSLVYANDQPWNCFPSTHCAVALMAALVMFEMNPIFGSWGLVVALTIGASTLFTKQHFLLDVVGGYSLTLLVYYAYFKGQLIEIMDKKQREFRARVESVIEGSLEEIVRRVVREELARERDEAAQERESGEGS